MVDLMKNMSENYRKINRQKQQMHEISFAEYFQNGDCIRCVYRMYLRDLLRCSQTSYQAREKKTLYSSYTYSRTALRPE